MKKLILLLLLISCTSKNEVHEDWDNKTCFVDSNYSHYMITGKFFSYRKTKHGGSILFVKVKNIKDSSEYNIPIRRISTYDIDSGSIIYINKKTYINNGEYFDKFDSDSVTNCILKLNK